MSLFSAHFSDTFGRKPTLFALTFLLCVLNLLNELLQQEYLGLNVWIRYATYCVTQFFTGAISKCIYF